MKPSLRHLKSFESKSGLLISLNPVFNNPMLKWVTPENSSIASGDDHSRGQTTGQSKGRLYIEANLTLPPGITGNPQTVNSREVLFFIEVNPVPEEQKQCWVLVESSDAEEVSKAIDAARARCRRIDGEWWSRSSVGCWMNPLMRRKSQKLSTRPEQGVGGLTKQCWVLVESSDAEEVSKAIDAARARCRRIDGEWWSRSSVGCWLNPLMRRKSQKLSTRPEQGVGGLTVCGGAEAVLGVG
ncbi:hypothetical protein J6590_015024 [Homalodisca vitripennis]|nr:hypothetical protein J6590_015024 [Homalodisca vitripennis]